MSRCIIYLLKNTVNDKVYVGQTWYPLKTRWSNGYNCCTHLYNAILKYGENKFYYEIIDEASNQETANFLEEHYISQYNSTNQKYGYNILSGGNNSKRSEELKNKVSKACQGINAKLDKETVMQLFNDIGTQKEIAIKYQVDQTTVADIKNGRSWSWLTGKKWNNSKMSEELVLAIFKETGFHKDIAKKYNTSRQTVGNIKNGIVYSYLTGKV